MLKRISDAFQAQEKLSKEILYSEFAYTQNSTRRYAMELLEMLINLKIVVIYQEKVILYADYETFFALPEEVKFEREEKIQHE